MRSICLSLLAIAIAVFSWHLMIREADTLPYFSDEVANVQATTSFFANGNYKNDRYGLVYSSGIAVTWPGAVGWNLYQNMLGSRLGCAFFSWFFAVLLGFYFLRNNGFPEIDSLVTCVSLWTVTVTSPFALPYWYGFMYNLGELNSIILIGFGLLLISRYPLWSAFMFGIAVWHGKYLYSPFVLAILLANLFAQKLPFKKMLTTAGLYFTVFLLPLFLWMGWLWLKFDVTTMKQWLLAQFGWLDQMQGKHAILPSTRTTTLTLRERLTSPHLEWAGYSAGTKIKDLLFSLGAIAITAAGLVAAQTGKLHISLRELWLSTAAATIVGVYSIWYFFIHQHMWQRHFQPAIYIGFGLFVFWGVKLARNCAAGLRPWFYAFALFLLAVQVAQELKHPFPEPQLFYARSCTDLYGTECEARDQKLNRF